MKEQNKILTYMQNQKSSMQNSSKNVNKNQNQYSEKDYWEGRVPDELFEEYLNKYGYEYTPPVDRNEST